ncbi:MAG: ATP-binding protein [Methylocystis sp.]|nr:ATP-binding protein [Methylocystis sp.]
MPTDLPAYRIFIASPGDVLEERARALRVVERLRGEFADQLHLSAIAWERKTYSAHADFQAQIEATRDCHLVVGILWQRIGTPLDALRYPREDGTPFESGTVFEIETALDLRRAGPLPDVALFKKCAPQQAALSAEDARQLAQDLTLLEAITRRWFHTESGAFKAAFNDFTSPEHFEALLEQHLRAWLAELGHSAEGRVWRIETYGSPYPGLSPYDAERERVFFGRDRARLAGRIALSEAAARGCPFLLIVGGSGAGKSSLARAGLLPSLALPGTAPGVDGWCVATLRPGAMPLAALAEAIFIALPAMAGGDAGTPGEWAATLLARPQSAAGAVARALEREGAGGRRLRLLLLADQLEEALDAPPAQRDAFAGALAALVQGGQWVVATLRADRYAALLDQPDLVALQEVGATQNLRPPDAEDIEAIIRGPARAAGLVFERRSDGRDLAQILQEEMEGADALPLLQMALERLFVERDWGANRLTFAAHAAMGGLRGAIQARADAVFAEADAAAQAELPAVLLTLAAGLSEAGLAIARPVAEAELATTPARRALLRVLVEGRLLVAERAASGAVQLRVAHEALLRNWPQAIRILAPEHLRAKPRLEAALADWRERGAKRRDLLGGTLLEAGLDLLRAHAAALPPTLADYIARSRRADRFRRFGKLGAAGSVAGVFFVLALLAWGFAHEVEREKALAEQHAEAAEAARGEAEREVARATQEQAIAAAARAVAGEQRAQAEAEAARADSEAAAAEVAFTAARQAANDMVFEIGRRLRFREEVPRDAVLDLLQQAGRTLDALLEHTPDDVWTRRARGVLHSELALTLQSMGRLTEALLAAEAAMGLYAELALLSNAAAVSQRDLWVGHISLGDLHLVMGDLGGANREFVASLAIAARLSDADPGDLSLQGDLYLSQQRIGDVLLSQGDRIGALAAFRAALATSQILAASDPANSAWQRDLSIGHRRIGDVLLSQGDSTGALAAFEASKGISQLLVASDAGNTVWQRELWFSHLQIGNAHMDVGDLSGARREFDAALQLIASLASAQPRNTELQFDLAVTLQYIGVAKDAINDISGAKAAFNASVEIGLKLVSANPDNFHWQKALASWHARLGDALAVQGDGLGGILQLNSSIGIALRFATANPNDKHWMHFLTMIHCRIGSLLMSQGDFAGAAREFNASMAIAVRLTTAEPSKPEWQASLAISRGKLGDLLMAQGDFRAAKEEFSTAMGIAVRLNNGNPLNQELRGLVLISHRRLGAVHLHLDEWPDAQQNGAAALALARAEHARVPASRLTAATLLEAEDLVRRIEAATP